MLITCFVKEKIQFYRHYLEVPEYHSCFTFFMRHDIITAVKHKMQGVGYHFMNPLYIWIFSEFILFNLATDLLSKVLNLYPVKVLYFEFNSLTSKRKQKPIKKTQYFSFVCGWYLDVSFSCKTCRINTYKLHWYKKKTCFQTIGTKVHRSQSLLVAHSQVLGFS